ncbi:MAG: hypothetical protein KJ890_15490 [Gammaproteobacteria bacterium]|nr:hypothetical protein [Gammaproteobacteria bacterium]MBU0801659.1 hypothetical protein [Alphaproteobacteria bacterium]MBU1803832.1 hypothetical protein [Gammaproteobacteria bacterium]
MKIKLKRLFDFADKEYINGYEVENFEYPGGAGFSGTVTLTLSSGDTVTLDQQQEVTLGNDGRARLTTTTGDQMRGEFLRTIPLTPADFS